MNIEQLIKNLNSFGVSVSLGLDLDYSKRPLPETEELIHLLNKNRVEVIEHLISNRFVAISEDVCLPSEWVMSNSMKKYVINTPSDVLKAIECGHSPLFCLLWCLKALCIINMRKGLYRSLVDAMQSHYGYDHGEYSRQLEVPNTTHRS